MLKRRRRDSRFQVEQLEGRAVPSITIVKAAIATGGTIHIIGYIEKTPVAGLSLSVSTILDIKGHRPDVFNLEPPFVAIVPLPAHTTKLPHGVKASEITGVFDATYGAPDNYNPKDLRKVVVNVHLLRQNGHRDQSAKKEQSKLEKLTGTPPYLV
jgi:hypothetical protein